MTNIKVEKIIIISFIGLIVAIFVGLGGNIILKAGLPASVAKTEIDFEKRLQSLEDDLVSGIITKQEYDSLAGLLRVQQKRIDEMSEANHNLEKIPEWVSKQMLLDFFNQTSNHTTPNKSCTTLIENSTTPIESCTNQKKKDTVLIENCTT